MRKAVRLQSRVSRNVEVFVITIPKDFVKSLNWQKGDILFVELEGNRIVIYKPS